MAKERSDSNKIRIEFPSKYFTISKGINYEIVVSGVTMNLHWRGVVWNVMDEMLFVSYHWLLDDISSFNFFKWILFFLILENHGKGRNCWNFNKNKNKINYFYLICLTVINIYTSFKHFSYMNFIWYYYSTYVIFNTYINRVLILLSIYVLILLIFLGNYGVVVVSFKLLESVFNSFNFILGVFGIVVFWFWMNTIWFKLVFTFYIRIFKFQNYRYN